MNQQQIRKIKEYAEKLFGLCVGEPYPSHKPDAIELPDFIRLDTSGVAEQMAYQAAETQDKLRRDYRKKVLALLKDDWVPIVRIFEDHKPQKIARLDDMRQSILCHTDPDNKCENWLEPRDGNFGPNEKLRSEVEQLANALKQVVQSARKERKWRIVKTIFYLIGVLAALFTCLGYLLGWLGPIKEFIYKIVGK